MPEGDHSTSLGFRDLTGKVHQPLVIVAQKAVVLVFISRDCPTSNAFLPEINKLAAEYGDRFGFYLIQADVGISADEARKHADFFEIKSPVLLDAEQRLVKLTHAKTTPEAVVLAHNGHAIYQGRINDLYKTQTSKRKEPTTHDLRDALEAILLGNPVANPRTKAIGCNISVVE